MLGSCFVVQHFVSFRVLQTTSERERERERERELFALLLLCFEYHVAVIVL